MASAGPSALRTCPNCFAKFGNDRTACPSCKLEVSKMAGYEAAKRAAQQKGIRRTEVEERVTPIWQRPGPIAGFVLVAGLVLAWFHFFGGPKVPPWAKYPGTREAAVQEFFDHIATGDDAEYDKAYALIAPSSRDPKDSDERGHYRGLLHAAHRYLSGEFGEGWNQQLQMTADPANPDQIAVKVGLETLHVQTVQQTPKEDLAKGSGEHFAVTGIAEFPIEQAAGFQSTEAQMGVVAGVAGQGAVNNLQTILGAAGGSRRETPMQKKVRMLPILRDPRQVTSKAIVRMWPVRNDPVVRNRLEQIKGDERFDLTLRQKATEVLTERVSDEDLIAAGVE